MNDDIRKEVEELRVKSVEAFKKEDYINTIYILEKAWDILPGNKIDEKESFTIASYILEAAIRSKNKKVMEKWIEKIVDANPARPDCGEREMWIGKVHYELGNFDKAKEYLSIAYQKSGGRSFTSRDMVYKHFLEERMSSFN